ncbi:hypothetical protein L7F22_022566 [Adiantum nelumboides]|nr:hypothetical protein [Adiantum nelumboides]
MKLSKQKAMESAGKVKHLKQNVVQDPRFSRLHTDPRFQRAFKRKLKIPIDSRFHHVFSDNRFSDPLALDKRGRKLPKYKKSSRKGHPLHQYYDINDDDSNEAHQQKLILEPDQNGKSSKHRLFDHNSDNHNSGTMLKTSESEEETDSKDVSGEISETLSTSSSSSEDSSDEEDTADSTSEEAEEEKVLMTETETRRLALVNMDWDHLRAVDLLAVMNSFLPKGGQILSVSVFPSEFGLQQMKEEEKRGPQKIFQSQSSDEDEEDADEGVNMERLRQYERDKLRKDKGPDLKIAHPIFKGKKHDDPDVHIQASEQYVELKHILEEEWGEYFPHTLKEAARKWYYHYPASKLQAYRKLKAVFIVGYTDNRGDEDILCE